MAKPQVEAREPDEIRQLLLEYLYQRHRTARGVKAQEIGIRDLQAEMKKRHNLAQQEVASNLDYLVQKEWVRKITNSSVYTGYSGTARHREQWTFKISDVGIDKIEGGSRFRRSLYGGINISGVGVVQVGDYNVVSNNHIQLASELEVLGGRLVDSDKLSDSQKVQAVADVETIRNQLAKLQPDPSIIRRAWSNVQQYAATAELIEAAGKAGQYLAPLIVNGLS